MEHGWIGVAVAITEVTQRDQAVVLIQCYDNLLSLGRVQETQAEVCLRKGPGRCHVWDRQIDVVHAHELPTF